MEVRGPVHPGSAGTYHACVGGSPPPKGKPPEGPDDAGADDRATLIPDFDPQDFARDSEVRQRTASGVEGEPTMDQARRLHDQGDDEGALFLLTRLLDLAPLHPDANKLADECRASLERQCLSAIGSESAVLVAAVTEEELKTFALDNVSAFLFSRLDGATKVEDILDISGLPRLLALRHLRKLLDRGLVVSASRARPRVTVQPTSHTSSEAALPRGEEGADSGVVGTKTGMSSGSVRVDLDPARCNFRVIAEGDDAVGANLTLTEALAVLEFAREHGKRHVAIVDDATGAMVQEEDARRWIDQD